MKYLSEAYSTFINDSGNKNGIELEGKKDIIYLQIIMGVTLPLKY